MGQAKSKYEVAAQHLAMDSRTPDISKVDSLRASHDDCRQKVEQAQDSLAAEMFNLLSKEPDICSLFLSWYRLQADYHRTVADLLEDMMPS
ncbi:ARHGAP17 [Cordylochernes scorpioides]|uniref:ARHGAP17 n=1 Tax=Cordylochernes scorpioides TaxID=51811 RepID=A0ABY6LKF7_9ARAC|nr:ARHGAP17 [Cordylochernes scorpioides]